MRDDNDPQRVAAVQPETLQLFDGHEGRLWQVLPPREPPAFDAGHLDQIARVDEPDGRLPELRVDD